MDCPVCGRPVPEPLPRGSLVPVVHSRGGGGPCRFWIAVAPREGVKHRIIVLGDGETFERAAPSIVPEHRRLVRRSVLLRAAMEREEDAGEEQEEWREHG